MPAQEAIKLYAAGDAHSDLNRALGQGKALNDSQQRLAEGLDAAMKPTPVATTLYRGVDLKFFNQGGRKFEVPAVGATVSSPTFLSTSAHRQVGLDFAKESRNGVMWEISVPAGHQHLPIPNDTGDRKVGMHHDEREVLLPRDTKMVVTKVRKQGGITYITAEVRP